MVYRRVKLFVELASALGIAFGVWCILDASSRVCSKATIGLGDAGLMPAMLLSELDGGVVEIPYSVDAWG